MGFFFWVCVSLALLFLFLKNLALLLMKWNNHTQQNFKKWRWKFQIHWTSLHRWDDSQQNHTMYVLQLIIYIYIYKINNNTVPLFFYFIYFYKTHNKFFINLPVSMFKTNGAYKVLIHTNLTKHYVTWKLTHEPWWFMNTWLRKHRPHSN